MLTELQIVPKKREYLSIFSNYFIDRVLFYLKISEISHSEIKSDQRELESLQLMF
jgi:hypothetical protein